MANEIIPSTNFKLKGDDFKGDFEVDVTLGERIGAYLNEPSELRAELAFELISAHFGNCRSEEDIDRLAAAAKMIFREARKRGAH